MRKLSAGQLEVFEHKRIPEPIPAPQTDIKRTEPVGVAANSREPQATKARYTWRVETQPAGAEVHEGGKKVCSSTPCRITHTTPDPRTIKVVAEGHKDGTATLARGGGTVTVSLEKTLSSMPRLQ
jgi:hypothetical protein